ncbi:TonB-dependent hemoglobin/transferrin/lactoferrin family receptor [Endozoicomonas arenosclerae]|uniref:TonB-dependent hemoglobin/transferrin/lactoferrin family receptor n=1 Tax=Endozoicomonas arenosclerae TaxID=1633495 RepID=UPI0007862B11|nr:TonB-dependent hemoglobin/transferrin/lactoferrin family receptor [Endozoicomonas arenosclerae]
MSLPAIQKTHLALAVMAVVAATAQAEEALPATQATLLDQVTVSATRTEQTLDSVASSVDVTTADDIEKRMVNDIDDLVRYEPGVNVTDDGRTGAGSFNIRGMDANRVKITVDGVDQAKAFDSTKMFLRSQRNFIDMESIKAVEVVKGPASTIHGSDAIGGVVAFVTKDPADFLKPEGDDSYASLKGGYSSADSAFTETGTLANRNGDLESMLIYTRRDAKETQTHSGADVTGDARGEADPKDIGINNILGKLQYQINDAHRVGLTAEWRKQNSDTDLKSLVGTQPQGNPSPYDKFEADDSTERKRLGVFHEWEAFTTAFDTLHWSLNWQESETNQITVDEMKVNTGGKLKPVWETQARNKDYIYKETSWQFDLNLTKELDFKTANHLFSYGLAFERKEQDNLNKTTYVQNPADEKNDIGRYAPLATVDSVGIYFQDEITLLNDRLTVTPGIRYDSFSPKTKTDQYYTTEVKDQSYDNWSAKLGAVYKFTDVISGFAQYSQGFGTPDMFAMYFEEKVPGIVHVKPNPELKPEKSDSIEVGLRANGSLGSAELTFFYNQYDNFIEQVYLGKSNTYPVAGIYQYQNLDDTKIKGVEFKGNLWLDEAFGAPVGTSLKTAIAWSKGRGTLTDANGNLLEDEPLNSIAPLTAVIGLGYDAPSENWGGELMWTLVAEKDKDDISQNDTASDETGPNGDQYATPGYGIVDMTTYYKPIKDVTLTAGIFNIADKKYWKWDDVRGLSSTYEGLNRYTQPGRNFSVSVKWEI